MKVYYFLKIKQQKLSRNNLIGGFTHNQFISFNKYIYKYLYNQLGLKYDIEDDFN